MTVTQRDRGAPNRVSFWFDELGAVPSRPALRGGLDADVCIVGGGLTGLWTAYELARAEPSLAIVVLEREHVGFGASGRNGGWVMGEVSGSWAHWEARGGRARALALRTAAAQAVDEIGRVIERERIACDHVKAGSLEVARTQPQLERLRERAAAERALLGAGDESVWLDADAARARVGVDGALAGRWTPHCACVQPAKLVTGLAAAAERHGVVIHEGTPVTELEPRRARTPAGEVRARWVVRATEAYTVELPTLKRSVLPVNSAMIVTEPLDDATWASIGWRRRETLVDGAHMYVYLQRTADGRIAIGGRGIPYRYASRTERGREVPQRTVDELRARLQDLFPVLAGARIDGAWHGVLGVARDWAPAVGIDAATGDAWALGYAGEGVAAANLAGRTLRDLILGRDTDLTTLPWVGPAARPWEPEPIRFVGIRSVYGLMRAADAAEARTGRPSRLAAVADLLAGQR